MLSQNMHPRIAELAKEILPLTENPPEKPTEADRSKLMSLRDKVKNLREESDITLSDSDERDRGYLYVITTREANRQEDFYERNGNKWAA
mgnify:CR=1 FL=1